MTCQKKFALRFAEICGSSEPSKVMEMLDVSYQSARNYLNGRLPSAAVLINIAEKTPYSIHWLLTGEGDKFVGNIVVSTKNAPVSTDQIGGLIREEFYQIAREILRSQAVADGEVNRISPKNSDKAARPRTIRLESSQIRGKKPAVQLTIQQKNKVIGKTK